MEKPLHTRSTPRRLRRLTRADWWLAAAAILLAGTAFQLVTTYRELVRPVGKVIWQIRDRPAWERTGVLSLWAGEDRTAFLGFLRTHTPPDSEVVFFEEHGLYSWWPALQYFLYPRHVSSCPDIGAHCWDALRSDTAYFVQVEGHPNEEDLPFDVEYIPYRGAPAMGVFQRATIETP